MLRSPCACDTWEASKHGVGVVPSVENLQRVPVLLRDKADHLDLRQRQKEVRKKRCNFTHENLNLLWRTKGLPSRYRGGIFKMWVLRPGSCDLRSQCRKTSHTICLPTNNHGFKYISCVAMLRKSTCRRSSFLSPRQGINYINFHLCKWHLHCICGATLAKHLEIEEKRSNGAQLIIR